MAKIYDLRGEQSPAAPRTRVMGGRTVRRDPRLVTTIMVHQTAVNFGVGKAALRRAGGDRDLALARRALRIPAHAVAFRQGFATLGHPLRSYVHGGGVANAWCLHLEIEGLYSGLQDDPETQPDEARMTTWRRREPDAFSGPIVCSARSALWRLVSEGRRMGMPIRRIIAHRQTSATRRSDPGEAIWRRLVLDYAVPCLGLATEPERTWGTGRPIPVAWQAEGVGEF